MPHGLPHDVPAGCLSTLCVMCRHRLACLPLSNSFRSSISSFAPPVRSLPLACFHRSPRRHGSAPRIAYRHASLLSSPHRPANRVEKRGGIIVLLTVMRGVSACLTLCHSCLNTLLGNLLKICLGKLLKTFTGNLLKNDWAYPSFYISAVRLSAVASLCVSACRLCHSFSFVF